jgi:DNA primase
MRLSQIGIPVVGLLGAHLSSPQRQLLKGVPRVVLLLDGDSTGRSASTQIKRALVDTTDVQIVCLPEKLDPDDLSDQQLGSILSPFY